VQARSTCLHCKTPIPPSLEGKDFCCTGCEAVYGLLHREGLGRYYELAGDKTAPVGEVSGPRSHSWLEPLVARAEEAGGSICTLDLDVQGIHCAACVWLMNELFKREKGGVSLHVNPGIGKVRLAWKRGDFDVERFVSRVEEFGYLFGPSKKTSNESTRSLLLRLGATAAIAGNVMLFSLAFYTGLGPEDGVVYELFTKLSVALSALVVFVGGWPFFRSAWKALSKGVLHLDLPIAAGILLAFGASLYQARGGQGELYYFDTLNVFVLLMLVGRWLQQRVLEKNQRFLLEDVGTEGITVRRREGDRLVFVSAPQIRKGDELVIAPGDLVPVDAEVQAPSAFTIDWITGEPDVVAVPAGGTVQAGAFNATRSAVTVVAKTDFEESPLPSLLRSTREERGTSHLRFWDLFARYYVAAVLLIATIGLFLWLPKGPEKALQVTVALLVVTCPCAIGIAIPLAYELAQARLRRQGLFVRSKSLLDKLPRVRKVLFDKTGTLTLGRLTLVDEGALDHLSEELRDALYDMVARSNHPVSRAIARALEKRSARYSAEANVHEVPGQGLELRRDGKVYRLGRADWAATGGAYEAASSAATVLSVDGIAAATFRTRETVRSDARREIEALRATGLSIWLVSGDSRAKVLAMAEELGIEPENVRAQMSPDAKAELVESLDREDTLFVGDGVNDSLAFSRAFVAGTPAVDRPVLPSRSDFFLLGEGIGAIRQAIELSKHLQRTVRRLIGIALAYNLLAISASMAGWMTPLRAAIAMPASSTLVLAFAVASMMSTRESRVEKKRKEQQLVPA